MFYTGYNRDYPAQGRPAQVLMHAVSDDLYHWTKTQDAITFTPQEAMTLMTGVTVGHSGRRT
ncbi:MAG: hypothetical protein ACLS6O_06520 [Bifidobacterium sp.]